MKNLEKTFDHAMRKGTPRSYADMLKLMRELTSRLMWEHLNSRFDPGAYAKDEARRRGIIEEVLADLSIPVDGQAIKKLCDTFKWNYTELREVVRLFHDCGKAMLKTLGKVAKLRTVALSNLKALAKYQDHDAIRQAIEVLEQDREQHAGKPFKGNPPQDMKPLFKKNTGPEQARKQQFWTHAISEAVPVVNQFCHTNNCSPRCRKFHRKAHEAVARILSALYPDIFPQVDNALIGFVRNSMYR